MEEEKSVRKREIKEKTEKGVSILLPHPASAAPLQDADHEFDL